MGLLGSIAGESFRLLLSAAGSARVGARPMLVAFAIAELVAVQILLPLAVFVVNWLILRSGEYAVANEDLVRFFASWQGLAAITVAAIIALTIDGLGRGAMLLALWRARERGRASGIGACLGAIWRIVPLLAIGTRKFLLSVALALPFILVIGVIALIATRNVDIYWLVNVKPARFWIALACIIPVATAGTWVVGSRWIGWSLALPLCLGAGRPAQAAIRESESLLAGKRWSVAGARVLWLIITGVVGVAVLILTSYLAERALAGSSSSLRLSAVVAGLVLVVHGVAAFGLIMAAAVGDAIIVDAAWRRYAPDIAKTATSIPAAQENRHNSDESAPSKGRQRVILLAVLAAGTVAVGAGTLALLETARRPVEIEITAHRGAATVAPENTIAAFNAAIAMGVDRIELDAMLTSDGKVVVFHDTDLRRIANDPRRIADMTLEQIRSIDAGTWFSPEFAGEPIPTLDEAIIAASKGTLLNIELKSVGGDESRLAAAVCEILSAHDDPRTSRAVVTSLSARVLDEVRQTLPKRRIGFIVAASVGDLRRVNADFLAVDLRLATRQFMERARQADMPLHVWGVKDPADFTRLALFGVEGVIVSDPALMLRQRAELSELTEAERLLLAMRDRIIESRHRSPLRSILRQ
jgi:glycerophosphoryl diester phosphodiesterase